MQLKMAAVAIALTVGLSAALSARADVTGQFQSGASAKYKIEYRDDRNFRVSFTQGGAMMVKGKYYVLQQLGDKTYAMDKAAIRRMMTKYKTKDSHRTKTILPKVSFTDLKKSETVAGIRGQLFKVKSTYADGQIKEEIAVLSEDKRVVNLQRAMVILAEEGRKMMQELGQQAQPNPFDTMGEFKKKGVLRYGQIIKLLAIDNRTIASKRFVRPPMINSK